MKYCRQFATGIPRDPKRGFALVISLTLMILLTALAVGLLSISTITLRASNQGKAMIIARENAWMDSSTLLPQIT
jgi:Tfp pilus assembly protein PilX